MTSMMTSLFQPSPAVSETQVVLWAVLSMMIISGFWSGHRTSAKKNTAGPNKPEVNDKQQETATESELHDLRMRNRVRPVTISEEGLGINRAPAGVYGFSYTPATTEAPLFNKKAYHSFEVHKLSDGTVLLVGFVTAETVSQMNTGKERIHIRLFADPQDEANILVSIPSSRIIRSKEHSIREGKGLELDLAALE